MCGIAGIILRGEKANKEVLRLMVDQLRHRGPDGSGFFTEGPFGLAHTRLAIIDLEGGQQPILADNRRMAIVANSEIYNYIELQEKLCKAGRAFSTRSDSETILQAYVMDHHNFIEHLNGMFAFAIYDGRRQRLVLGRDRLGIKPLFYAALPDRFLFASELKAILPLLPSKPEVNPKALSQFLNSRFSTGNETIISCVHRVAPGEIIEVDRILNVTHRKYWCLCPVKPQGRCFEDAQDEFQALFDQVMKEHIRSDVPFGLFLSGGNDSAILCAMLSSLQKQPVKTFSVGYKNTQIKDELDDAEQIARMFGTQHTTLRLGKSDFFRRIPHAVWAVDELMRDAATFPTSALSEMASKELKVVFVGEGGDEVFAGYRRYRQPVFLRWAKSILSPGSGGFRTRSEWWRTRSQRVMAPKLKALNSKFREPFIRAWKEAAGSGTHLQSCQYTDITTALPDNLLVKVDRTMMSFALEGRVPFLDHRIVEFGMSLPDRLKVSQSSPKIFLRRWAERYLPKDYLFKKKRGFFVPVRQWLRGQFLDRLEKKLTQNKEINKWFDTREFPALFQAQHRKGNASREIFGLMQFAIWHRLFIEQPGVKPTTDENPLDWIS